MWIFLTLNCWFLGMTGEEPMTGMPDRPLCRRSLPPRRRRQNQVPTRRQQAWRRRILLMASPSYYKSKTIIRKDNCYDHMLISSMMKEEVNQEKFGKLLRLVWVSVHVGSTWDYDQWVHLLPVLEDWREGVCEETLVRRGHGHGLVVEVMMIV